MLGATLIRDEVLQVRKPCEKRLLAPFRMMKPFHRTLLLDFEVLCSKH